MRPSLSKYARGRLFLWKGQIGMSMNDDLTSIQDQVREGVAKALTPEALEELRVQILGRKGSLTQVMHQMGKLDPEERPIMGKMANDVRARSRSRRKSCSPALQPSRPMSRCQAA